MKFSVLVLALFFTTFLTFPATAQTTPPQSADTKAASSAAEQEIILAARDRADSLTNHGCDKWASYVADDFQDIEPFQTESHDVLLNGCRQEAKVESGCKSERELSDFHFRFTGSFAFVHYLYKITEHCGEYKFPSPHRQVDTYEKRKSKWVALYAVEVAQVEDPPVAKIDPAILDDYTGQYGWEKARMVDTVTRTGNKLYIQTTGDGAPTELVPLGENRFFIRGSLNRNTFVRDSSGKVVENRGYSADAGDQTGYKAKKIK